MTSFSGFLYEPISGRKVIWSVSQSSNLNGPLDPFPFDAIWLNVGNGWSSTANKFVIPYVGVYQLHWSIRLSSGAPADYRLKLNGVDYASILCASSNHGYETRSRSIMIDASVGDTFHIVLAASTWLMGCPYQQTSFTGFLISS